MVEFLGFCSILMLREWRRNLLLVEEAEKETELVVERHSGLGWDGYHHKVVE